MFKTPAVLCLKTKAIETVFDELDLLFKNGQSVAAKIKIEHLSSSQLQALNEHLNELFKAMEEEIRVLLVAAQEVITANQCAFIYVKITKLLQSYQKALEPDLNSTEILGEVQRCSLVFSMLPMTRLFLQALQALPCLDELSDLDLHSDTFSFIEYFPESPAENRVDVLEKLLEMGILTEVLVSEDPVISKTNILTLFNFLTEQQGLDFGIALAIYLGEGTVCNYFGLKLADLLALFSTSSKFQWLQAHLNHDFKNTRYLNFVQKYPDKLLIVRIKLHHYIKSLNVNLSGHPAQEEHLRYDSCLTTALYFEGVLFGHHPFDKPMMTLKLGIIAHSLLFDIMKEPGTALLLKTLEPVSIAKVPPFLSFKTKHLETQPPRVNPKSYLQTGLNMQKKSLALFASAKSIQPALVSPSQERFEWIKGLISEEKTIGVNSVFLAFEFSLRRGSKIDITALRNISLRYIRANLSYFSKYFDGDVGQVSVNLARCENYLPASMNMYIEALSTLLRKTVVILNRMDVSKPPSVLDIINPQFLTEPKVAFISCYSQDFYLGLQPTGDSSLESILQVLNITPDAVKMHSCQG